MPGILHNISVRFTALVGGFVGPIGAAGGAVRGLTRTIDQSTGRQRRAFTNLGQTGTMLGLGLAAGFGLAVKAAADFDKAMSKVSAVSNATAAEMTALRKAALKAGKDTKYSATQAAEAEAELAKAGIKTADILGGALTGALDLAAAGGLELEQAATVAAQAMNIFKLEGKDVTHVADVLAAGANKSAADVKGLAWSLRMGGQVAAQTGLRLEDTVGVLSAFADNALIGSDAGTSLKVMLQHLANPSDKAAGMMADLGLEVYDASGKFVGMQALAGNLQKALGSLTQEQRDQAMATIFGSDAVRGANVLFKIGAQGVLDYTNAVNDTGAAQRTAAELTNNLAGDFERLKGSIETALIQSGSSANGVLREMTQALNGVVNGFLSLPPAMQSTTVVVIGVTGAVILLAKGMIFMVATARDAKIALIALGVTGPRVAAAMAAVRTAMASTAAFMTGPWGIAIAAGVAILSVWMFTKKKATKATDEYVAAIEADTGAMGENTRAAVVNDMQKSGMLKTANDLALNTADVTDAIMGNKDALDRVNAALDDNLAKLRQHLIDVPADEDAVIHQSTAIHKFRESLEDETKSMSKSVEVSKQKKIAMGESKDATDKLATSTEHVTEAVQGHDEAEAKLVETMKSAATTAKDLQQAFDNLAKTNMELDKANIKVKESTKAAAEASDKRRGISDKEKLALIQVAENSQNSLVSLKATGVYGDELFAKQNKLANSFIKTAMSMGATDKYARDLARRYGLLITVTGDASGSMENFTDKVREAAGAASRLAMRTGGEAKNATDAFRASIEKSLPVLYAMAGGNKRLRDQVDALARSAGITTAKINISKRAFLDAARAMGVGADEANELWKKLGKLKSKTIKISVDAQGYWALPKNQEMHDVLGHNYYGGRIESKIPGASRDRDSVPSLLRVDEHVWTPEEVDAVGGHDAMYRMRHEAKAGRLKGFYFGGRVGNSALSAPGAAAAIMSPIGLGYDEMVGHMAAIMADTWKKSMSGGSVVGAARAMIGLPYSWGGGGQGGPSYGIGRGAGTYGFDCSGLTEYAWWKGRHLSIGGWTGDQIGGSSVIGSPRPGALGFPHPGHVVLYSGNNRVIQAPNTGSFVNEGPISRSYTWRWPNNAKYYGGAVTRAEAEAGRRYTRSQSLTEDLLDMRAFGLAGDPGRIAGYAGGGRVTGRPGLDNLMLRGTAGEFMVNADATRRYGPWLDMINSGIGDSLISRSVRSGPGGGGSGTMVVHLHNHGVLGSQMETEQWLTKSMENLRRKGKLPAATG